MFSSPVARVRLDTKESAQGITMSVPFQVITSCFDEDSSRFKYITVLTGK
jgi:hypothetical protein